MIKQFIFIVYALVLTSNGYGQSIARADRANLVSELNKSKEDTNKVLLLIKIGNQYESNTPDTALRYYKAAGDLSKKLNYKVGILKYISNYTSVLNMKNKFEESLTLNLEAIELARQVNIHKQMVAAYVNTGATYYGMRLYDKCMEYFLKASLMCEVKNDTASLVIIYSNMAGLYSEMETQSSKGYAYGLKALAIGRAIKDTFSVVSSLQNISGILMDTKNLDSALILLNEANSLSKKINNKYGQLSALVNINNIYVHKRRYDWLENNAYEIIKLATELDEKQGMVNGNYYLGKFYFEQKKYQMAKDYTVKALVIAKENDLKKLLGQCYLFLSDIELSLGNLQDYHKYAVISDSVNEAILSDKIEKNVQDFEARYALDKKQTEIDRLHKENEIRQLIIRQRNLLTCGLAGVIAVVIVIGFLYYRNTQQKKKLFLADATLQQQKINELETEKQLLATRSVLQGQEEERKRLAKDLHDGLGSILSGAKFSFNSMKNNLTISPDNALAFDRSIALLDQSIQELRRVAHNMMPEALVNFGLDTALRDFCNSINQSTALQLTYQSFDLDDNAIPNNKTAAIYRIIQELVNNILKHAQAKTALVQLVKKDASLSITVEDDGQGFEKSILQNNAGIGYINLQNRVAYIGGKLDLKTAIGKGTSVSIEIPDITND